MKKIIRTDRVKNEKVLQNVKEERNILDTIKQRQANWTGPSCVKGAFYNTILKERQTKSWNGWKEEEEDVSNYWMKLMNREVTETWKRKLQIALSGELFFEESVELSQDKLCDDEMIFTL